MDTIEVAPIYKVKGSLIAPASKSYAQRAIAIASFSQEKTKLYGLGNNNDVIAALEVVRQLGVKFSYKDDALVLIQETDAWTKRYVKINCGESGLSTRMFSAFSLCTDQPFEIKGEGSILKRSMAMVRDGLVAFGKFVESREGKLPFKISGEITNNTLTIDGSITSQFLTGLLIAAPFLQQDTIIHVNNLKSKPYIEITLDLLSHFGIKISHKNFTNFKIKGNQSIQKEVEYIVEGDWSSAAFLAVAGAIGGRICIEGLNKNSVQGDSAVLHAIQDFGSRIIWEDEVLIVEKKKKKPFVFDATECPDLFPPLTVLAAYAHGVSEIKGVLRLLHKESNRAKTLQEEFKKVGVRLEINEDTLFVYGKGGGNVIKHKVIQSHNDHRIAMAMSLFAIGANYPILIANASAINKSYPNFFKDFERVGC